MSFLSDKNLAKTLDWISVLVFLFVQWLLPQIYLNKKYGDLRKFRNISINSPILKRSDKFFCIGLIFFPYIVLIVSGILFVIFFR